jgi:hypothetical protein
MKSAKHSSLFFNFSFGIALSVLFINCQSSSVLVTNEDLTGKWEMTSAKRDGLPTETLMGSYFIFNEDGTGNSNFFTSEDKSVIYSIKGDIIRFDNNELYDFKVLSIDQDELRLQVNIKDIIFDMMFQREE